LPAVAAFADCDCSHASVGGLLGQVDVPDKLIHMGRHVRIQQQITYPGDADSQEYRHYGQSREQIQKHYPGLFGHDAAPIQARIEYVMPLVGHQPALCRLRLVSRRVKVTLQCTSGPYLYEFR
jgi:hypothetical protein